MTIELKEWAVPIRFEGVELSPIAIAIDHLGMYGNLPGLSEESSAWLWHFTICRGCVCTDSASNIRRVVSETLELVNNSRELLLESVPKRFDGAFTQEHLSLWVEDLQKMLKLSRGKETCSWESAP